MACQRDRSVFVHGCKAEIGGGSGRGQSVLYMFVDTSQHFWVYLFVIGAGIGATSRAKKKYCKGVYEAHSFELS